MATLFLSKKESVFWILSFLFSFYSQSTSTVLLSVLIFLLFVFKRKEIYFVWSILAPRITGSAPILTYLLAFGREEGPGNKQLDDLLEIDIPFLPRLIFVFKESYVKRLLTSETENFPSGGSEGPMVQIAADSGKNILLSSGPPDLHWARYREISSPLNRDRFGEGSLLAQMFDITWRTTQSLSKSHFAGKRGVPLNLFKEIFEIMIPAHNRALFGEDNARKFTYNDMSSEVYDIISETGKQLKFNFCPPWIKPVHKARIKRVTDAIRYMTNESTSPFSKSFSDAKKAGKLSEEELISNMMIYEFAQAPLHVVFWLLYLLATHVDEEKKVVAEIADVLSRGPLTYERLPEFKYLSRAIMETLRLYPGVGLLQVRSSKYNTMFGDHFVPQGSLMFLCAYMIHRNATYWPNPDEFDPSREGIDAARYGENLSFIPFGNGPRQCQGQYFALDLIKVTMISILQHYKVSLAPNQKEVVPTEIGFLRPAYPIFVEFETRVLPTSIPAQVPEKVGESSIPPPIKAAPVKSVSILQPAVQQLRTSGGSEKPAIKKLPSRYKFSNSSRVASLASQSQIFKDSFISIGRLTYLFWIHQPDKKDEVLFDLRRNNKDILVLYGSQTGTTRGFAYRIVQMAKLCKLSATLVALSDLDVSTVNQYKSVVIATSTYGDGGPPENADKFAYWLEQETNSSIFRGVPYAVLSLGSSLYPFPFKFGSFVSKRLAQLGARQILPDQKLDEVKYNQSEEFTKWSVRLFDSIGELTQSKSLVAHNKLLGFQDFDFSVLGAPFKLSFTNQVAKFENRKYLRDNEARCSVISNELANSDPGNQLYLLELKYEPNSLSFQQGDNVVISPVNPREMVEKYIARLGFEGNKVFNMESDENNNIELSSFLGKNKCTVEIALSHFFDITNPPSLSLLKFLVMKTDSPKDQKVILSYIDNYPSFVALQLSPLDVLEALTSIQLIDADPRKSEEALALFFSLLGPIKLRHYSVANFPRPSSNTLRILYKVVTYTTKNGNEKLGVCTHYLKSKKEGEEVIVSVGRTKFRMPSDPSTPVVFLSAGSGLAPYLGFLEQRNYQQQQGTKVGKSILIHGCRTESDFACKSTLVDKWLGQGILGQLLPAYSRQADVPRTHVQDVILKHGELIWNGLQEGATLFLCGDLTVVSSIREALITVAKTHGKLSIFSAHAYVRKLVDGGRLRTDEWGVTTSSKENLIRAARLKLWRKSILATFAFHLRPKTL